MPTLKPVGDDRAAVQPGVIPDRRVFNRLADPGLLGMSTEWFRRVEGFEDGPLCPSKSGIPLLGLGPRRHARGNLLLRLQLLIVGNDLSRTIRQDRKPI